MGTVCAAEVRPRRADSNSRQAGQTCRWASTSRSSSAVASPSIQAERGSKIWSHLFSIARVFIGIPPGPYR